MYAYAHNTTPIANLKLSPYQILFHTHPRIPLSFDLNLTRNSTHDCTSSSCFNLPAHSHYQSTDLNPFFSSLISKPISTSFLVVESAMLETYSTVHKHLNYKLSSSTSTFETTHQKQLPLNTFVIHKNFKPVRFSNKLKPLRIDPYKIIRHLSAVTYELLSQTGEFFHTHRNHIFPYYPKEPVIFPYLQNYTLLSSSHFYYSHSSDEDHTPPASPQHYTSNYEDMTPQIFKPLLIKINPTIH